MYSQALKAKDILDTVDEEHGEALAEIYFNAFLIKKVRNWYGNRNRSMEENQDHRNRYVI